MLEIYKVTVMLIYCLQKLRFFQEYEQIQRTLSKTYHFVHAFRAETRPDGIGDGCRDTNTHISLNTQHALASEYHNSSWTCNATLPLFPNSLRNINRLRFGLFYINIKQFKLNKRTPYDGFFIRLYNTTSEICKLAGHLSRIPSTLNKHLACRFTHDY